MGNLGNAWHVPANPELPGLIEGMRSPVFPVASSSPVAVRTGNQFAGPVTQATSSRRAAPCPIGYTPSAAWTSAPMLFDSQGGNNKYYSSSIPIDGLAAGTVVEYYMRITYDDHDTTFLQLNADGTTSLAVADESSAQAEPFRFVIETPS